MIASVTCQIFVAAVPVLCFGMSSPAIETLCNCVIYSHSRTASWLERRMQNSSRARFTGSLDTRCAQQEFPPGGWMQGKWAKLSLVAVSVLALAMVQPLWGQQPAGQVRKLTQSHGAAIYDDTQWSPEQDIQLLKSNIRSQKKQIVAANMDLTDAESEKFWPLYNRYATDVAKIYDTKIALFQEYLETYDSMSGEQAESYLRRRAAVEEDLMQVRLKYLPEFRKVLTGRETALFFQIDWRLDLMINLQLAQAPMVNP